MKAVIFNLAVGVSGAFTGILLTTGMSFGKFWKNLMPEGVLDWFASNPKGAMHPD